MSSLLLYFIGVFLLVVLSLFVVYNFVRYRFKGDKTLVFITLFAVAFVADLIFTITLLQNVTTEDVSNEFGNFSEIQP